MSVLELTDRIQETQRDGPESEWACIQGKGRREGERGQLGRDNLAPNSVMAGLRQQKKLPQYMVLGTSTVYVWILVVLTSWLHQGRNRDHQLDWALGLR